MIIIIILVGRIIYKNRKKRVFNIERVDEEITDYSLVIDTPKINMHNVKALLIHDFVNEEAYPSVGIFDSPKELQAGSKDKIVLNGHIQTINDISNTTSL